MENYQKLIEKLDLKYTKLNEPLKLHTTTRVGGPADVWYDAPTTEDFVNTIKLARELNVPVTVLGRGSNVLISDNGIRGLVIKSSAKQIQIGDEVKVEESEELEKETEARWASATEEEGARKMYEFKDLDYHESDKPRVEVKMDAGVDMTFAINYLINQGVTGLQWFSRIPGNLGGWIYNNAHGGTHFINEVLKEVRILDENGAIITLKHSDLSFGYDSSRFHKTNEIILDATLELYKGDAARARQVVIEWAKRKSIQPSISNGCVFANISNDLKEKLNYPSGSVGYVIEHIFKMTGFRVGDAAISPQHHNFIENKGNATASDYLAIIKEIQSRAGEKLGFKFTPEIFFLGFSEQELQGVK